MSAAHDKPTKPPSEVDAVYHVPKHGKGRLRLWQPGQSGNPSGKGGRYHEVQRMANDAAPDVFKALIDIALNPSEDTRCRIVAGQEVLGRAYGRIPAVVKPEVTESASTNEMPGWYA